MLCDLLQNAAFSSFLLYITDKILVLTSQQTDPSKVQKKKSLTYNNRAILRMNSDVLASLVMILHHLAFILPCDLIQCCDL